MKEKILVVGDAMMDRHIYGSTERISPEGPVPVVLKHDEEWALGAAANVAAHITAADIECFLAFRTCHPGNVKPKQLKFVDMCSEKGIGLRPLRDPRSPPLTLKTRIWSNGQQVCRIDEEDVRRPSEELELEWVRTIVDIIDHHEIDAVIFSDYNKGTLTNKIIRGVAGACGDRKIITVLDPKRPSFWKCREVDLIKPNRVELAATNMTAEECSSVLGESGRDGGTWLVNTLGKDGMAVYRNGELIMTCPTVAQDVVDVCGCGDTVTALLAVALMRGFEIKEAVRVANCGASFTIRHKGCYVLTRKEMEVCCDKTC